MQTASTRATRIASGIFRAASIGLAASLLVMWALGQTAVPSPDSAKKLQWHTYVNKSYGFSISYPDPYRPVPLPPPDEGDKYRTWDKRLLLLQRSDDPDGKIWVILDQRPFSLKTISNFHAPTGYDEDDPPPKRTIGQYTFYFYGAGGGGAEYPDSYFVEFKGKILDIYFDGPYDEKSPNQETAALEPLILKTFRVR
jgi:hypothetical protein